MKKINLVFVALLTFFTTHAQVKDFLTNVLGPTAIAVGGDYLYYCQANAGKVSRVLLNGDTPVPETVINGLDNPTGLVVSENFLYISETDKDRVLRIDITGNLPRITFVNLIQPRTLKIFEGELYILHRQPVPFSTFNEIVKVDLQSDNPIPERVAVAFHDDAGFVVMEDYLIYTSPMYGEIYGIPLPQDIPNADFLKKDLHRPEQIILYDEELYFAQSSLGRITKMETVGFIAEDVVLDITDPTGLAVHNGTLYIGQFSEGKISRISLIKTATQDLTPAPAISIYPNPVSDYLLIDQLEEAAFARIRNLSGTILKELWVANQEVITLTDLVAGVYFLEIVGRSLKFVKQ